MDLSDDSCNYLIDICNSDYSRILLELDKISNAKQFYDLDDKNCFKMCLSSKLFYEPPEDVVFSLIDAILTRNTKLAYELLEESKRRNDSTIMILSILHNNAKQLLQVQEMCACKDKSEFTGLTPFQLKSASKYINRYNTKELIRFIRMIRYCDKSIKDGTMTDDIVIDYIFINIFRKD
jgi:DNA polymerase III delta subunit